MMVERRITDLKRTAVLLIVVLLPCTVVATSNAVNGPSQISSFTTSTATFWTTAVFSLTTTTTLTTTLEQNTIVTSPLSTLIQVTQTTTVSSTTTYTVTSSVSTTATFSQSSIVIITNPSTVTMQVLGNVWGESLAGLLAIIALAITLAPKMLNVKRKIIVCEKCGFRNPPFAESFCVKCGHQFKT
jgi:ribosomal protein L40E